MKSQFSHYLSLYRNLWNYLLHTNDFTLYIKEIRPFFMPIWRLKNPPLADCVHRSKKNQYHKTLDICTCWQKVQSLKTAHSSKTPWPSHMSHVQSSQANIVFYSKKIDMPETFSHKIPLNHQLRRQYRYAKWQHCKFLFTPYHEAFLVNYLIFKMISFLDFVE